MAENADAVSHFEWGEFGEPQVNFFGEPVNFC